MSRHVHYYDDLLEEEVSELYFYLSEYRRFGKEETEDAEKSEHFIPIQRQEIIELTKDIKSYLRINDKFLLSQ